MVPPDNAFFVANGRLFGYPNCCIQSFLERVERVHRVGRVRSEPIQEAISNKTGYIPCMDHAREYTKTPEGPARLRLIRNTLKGRRYPLPFPHDLNTLARAVLRPGWEEKTLTPMLQAAVAYYGSLLRGEILLQDLFAHPNTTRPLKKVLAKLLAEDLDLSLKHPHANANRAQALKQLDALQGVRGSNPRPSDLESDALPTELTPYGEASTTS